MTNLIDTFDKSEPFTHGDISHVVYSKGSGPSVVILHEVFGLDEACLKFAIGLSRDFRVHVPLLFGDAGSKQWIRNVASACISRELAVFASRQTSPIVGWLRPLCAEIESKSEYRGIGVVGMCVTGGFALALAADESVLAPVVAQASAPILCRSSLGLSPSDKQALVQRMEEEGRCVLGLRFKYDVIAPRQRVDAIQELIPGAFRYIELEGSLVPGRRHATLTLNPPNTEAIAATTEFLKERLSKRKPN